jgi:hypothetical protein
MTLVYHKCEGGSIVVETTHCPACNKDMRRSPRTFAEHLEVFHGPEDFDLDPLADTPNQRKLPAGSP